MAGSGQRTRQRAGWRVVVRRWFGGRPATDAATTPPPTSPTPGLQRRTDWASLPPLRTTRQVRTREVSHVGSFARTLQRQHAPPSALAPLGHVVTPAAPGGTVTGLATSLGTPPAATSHDPTPGPPGQANLTLPRPPRPTRTTDLVGLGPRVTEPAATQPGHAAAPPMGRVPEPDAPEPPPADEPPDPAPDAASVPVPTDAGPAGAAPPVARSIPPSTRVLRAVEPMQPRVRPADPAPRPPGVGHRPLAVRRSVVVPPRRPAADDRSTRPDPAGPGPVPARRAAPAASAPTIGTPDAPPTVPDPPAAPRSRPVGPVGARRVDHPEPADGPAPDTPPPRTGSRSEASSPRTAPTATPAAISGRTEPWTVTEPDRPGSDSQHGGPDGDTGQAPDLSPGQAPTIGTRPQVHRHTDGPAVTAADIESPAPRPRGLGAPLASLPGTARPFDGDPPTSPTVTGTGRDAAIARGVARLLPTTGGARSTPSRQELAAEPPPLAPTAVARHLPPLHRAPAGPDQPVTPLAGDGARRLARDVTRQRPLGHIPESPESSEFADGATAVGSEPPSVVPVRWDQPAPGAPTVSSTAPSPGTPAPAEPTPAGRQTVAAARVPDDPLDREPAAPTGRAAAPVARVPAPSTSSATPTTATTTNPVDTAMPLAVARSVDPPGPTATAPAGPQVPPADGSTPRPMPVVDRSPTVQRRDEAPATTGGDTPAPEATAASGDTATGDDSDSAADPDMLFRKLYPRVRDELRWELRVQRERAGMLSDPL